MSLSCAANCTRSCYALMSALVVISVPRLTNAQEIPDATPIAADAEESLKGTDAKARAKQLFERGMERFDAADYEGALVLLLQSRQIFPSAHNTFNAAICLQRLGRLDEALDLYETALTRFAEDLEETNRTNTATEMVELAKKIGVIEIHANVEPFFIAVDGRLRRDNSDSHRVRVLPGTHAVRITRNGFLPFETSISVGKGRVTRVTAKLKPIGSWVRIECDGPVADDANLFVDGGPVGAVPWEGFLGPGEHVVWIEGAEWGTAPAVVRAVEGDIAVARLRPERLGGNVEIAAVPASAELRLDGVRLGRGHWKGRLPARSYSLEIAESGYRRKLEILPVPSGKRTSSFRFNLSRDSEHPRWRALKVGHFWMGSFAGYAGGPSLGSGAAIDCPGACTDRLGVHGLSVGLRGGYQLPFGLSLELHGGFLWLGEWLSRRREESFGPSGNYKVTYNIDDRLRFRGPFVSAGASYRWGLTPRVGVVARASAGVLLVISDDFMKVTASGGGETIPIFADRKTESGGAVRSAAAFVVPEIGIEGRVGAFDVGAALAVQGVLTDGPSLDHHGLDANSAVGCSADSSLAHCAPVADFIDGERAYGPFVVLIPQITVRRTF